MSENERQAANQQQTSNGGLVGQQTTNCWTYYPGYGTPPLVDMVALRKWAFERAAACLVAERPTAAEIMQLADFIAAWAVTGKQAE